MNDPDRLPDVPSPESSKAGGEYNVESLPATLLSKNRILTSAEALTAHLPEEQVGHERPMVMPQEWGTLPPGVEVPKLYFGHSERHGHLEDPEGGMTLDVIAYPASEGKPEAGLSRATIELGRDSPDGGRNVIVVSVGGKKSELERSTFKEYELTQEQVDKGVDIHTLKGLTGQLSQYANSHPDYQTNTAGNPMLDPEFSARVELAIVKVVRQGELTEGDAQRMGNALAELQRRRDGGAGEIAAP